jgi:hypothetical protein
MVTWQSQLMANKMDVVTAVLIDTQTTNFMAEEKNLKKQDRRKL